MVQLTTIGHRVLDIIDNADTLLGIDCVRLESLTESDRLKQNILSQGKIIYDKDRAKKSDLFMAEDRVPIAYPKSWRDSLIELGKAITKLRRAFDRAGSLVQDDEREENRDSIIKRFEFTIELFWKTLKKILRYELIKANSPKEVLQASYMTFLIDDETIWLHMLEDRNLTSHTYKEALAKEILARIGTYLPILESAYHALAEKYKQLA